MFRSSFRSTRGCDTLTQRSHPVMKTLVTMASQPRLAAKMKPALRLPSRYIRACAVLWYPVCYAAVQYVAVLVAMLCYAVLCGAVFCYATLCYATLTAAMCCPALCCLLCWAEVHHSLYCPVLHLMLHRVVLYCSSGHGCQHHTLGFHQSSLTITTTTALQDNLYP